jgi:hypothetical protein
LIGYAPEDNRQKKECLAKLVIEQESDSVIQCESP